MDRLELIKLNEEFEKLIDSTTKVSFSEQEQKKYFIKKFCVEKNILFSSLHQLPVVSLYIDYLLWCNENDISKKLTSTKHLFRKYVCNMYGIVSRFSRVKPRFKWINSNMIAIGLNGKLIDKIKGDIVEENGIIYLIDSDKLSNKSVINTFLHY